MFSITAVIFMSKRINLRVKSLNRLLCLTLTLVFSCFFSLEAFHIVGGEIEMIHIGEPGEYRYRINVIQYFDRAQTFNPGPEAQIFVFTYRKRDRALMRQDTLLLTAEEPVLYTNPDCAIASLQTDRVLFTKEITLDPDQFDDPEGYVFVWERCCRNGAVVNINNPLSTGMTYTVDFPPIVKDGVPFVNSTPSLFPPLSDFACVGELYYVDFAGTDLDGDEIVYSLSEPLNSSSTTALPIPQFPDPNRKVVWVEGIDNSNIIPGSPPLNINSQGFVTVRPENPGLYVFAALAEEFRDGVKIGEARRDFQLLVIDGCEPGSPPEVTARKPDGDFYVEGEVFEIEADATVEEHCFEFLVTDMDGGENIDLRALAVNFEDSLDGIFSFNSGTINALGDTLRVEVCVPRCPYLEDENFIIDLIAGDDSCPLPRLDTLRMTFDVEPPPNDPPMWTLIPGALSVNEGSDPLTRLISATDPNGDVIDIKVLNEGFNLGQFGMSFDPDTGEGSVTSTYTLDPDCIEHSFGLQNEFELQVAVEDRDECMFVDADTFLLDVTVVLPTNQDPVVSTSTGQTTINVALDELIDFEVSATDADTPGDSVTLEAVGREIPIEDLGIDFITTTGFRETSAGFSWQFDCANIDLMGNEQFTIDFIATDGDKCKVPNADTLSVTFNLLIPPNNPPVLSGYDDGDVIDARVNAPIEQRLTGIDPDGDGLRISLLDTTGIEGADSFEFPTTTGVGTVSSILSWSPECSLLSDDDTPEFDVTFILNDDSCPNTLADTITVTFRLFESPVSFEEFTPPNVITPNGDTFNEFFSLSGNEDNAFNLPPDSCDDTFINVTVVNRYGKAVFESSDREFVWDATDFTEGTYYYNLTYTRSEYRGVLTVVQ